MHSLKSCRNGRDHSRIEVNQANNIGHIRGRIDLIGREIRLGQQINLIGAGVGDENCPGSGRDAIRCIVPANLLPSFVFLC